MLVYGVKNLRYLCNLIFHPLHCCIVQLFSDLPDICGSAGHDYVTQIFACHQI